MKTKSMPALCHASRPLHLRITASPARRAYKTGMKHTVLALLLAIGLFAPGCADGRGSSGAHDVDRRATLVLLGATLAGVALLGTRPSARQDPRRSPGRRH